jgi:hypothetical protein
MIMATGKDGYEVRKVKDMPLDKVAEELERLNSLGTYRTPKGETVEGEYDISSDGMCIKFYPDGQAKKHKGAEQVIAEAGIDQIK